MVGITATAQPGAGSSSHMHFTGRRRELVWLLLKNFLLNLLTIGIYRFWARTRLRAYFWRNVEIAGEAVEYTGRGIELFVGFLIVVAVLSVIGIPFFIAGYLAEGSPEWVRITFQVIYYLVFFLLIQIAIFRARRYRTTRTFWRGIRFWLDGSAMRYTWISFFHAVLMLITLGFATPWRRVALQRYLIDNTRFGGRYFRFDGTGRDLFPIWSIVMLARIGFVVLLAALNASLYPHFAAIFGADRAADPNVLGQHINVLAAHFVWWPLLLIPVLFVLDLWYSVREFVYFVDRMAFGDVTFSSSLRTPQVIWYLVVYGVLVLIGFAATMGILGVVTVAAATGGAKISVLRAISPFLGVVLFLGLFALMNVLRIAWLYFQLVRVGCRTLSISNIAAVETVVQSADEADRFGEGLADVMDFGDI